METLAFLDHLQKHSSYKNQIAHVAHIASREPSYGELTEPLHPTLLSCLEEAHLLPLYSHQAQAINAIRSGKNAFVVTPSASGKTLCYNVPVLDRALREKRSCALYIFPTKALSQDQLRSLQEVLVVHPPCPQVEVAHVDGKDRLTGLDGSRGPVSLQT